MVIGRQGGPLLPALTLLLAVVIVALRLLYPLADASARNESHAGPASAKTGLGAAILAMAEQHPGTSGILPLGSGLDAFAARLGLARAAERTINAQHYIWRDDLTGVGLLSKHKAAAERGVRVRVIGREPVEWLPQCGTSGPDASAETPAMSSTARQIRGPA